MPANNENIDLQNIDFILESDLPQGIEAEGLYVAITGFTRTIDQEFSTKLGRNGDRYIGARLKLTVTEGEHKGHNLYANVKLMYIDEDNRPTERHEHGFVAENIRRAAKIESVVKTREDGSLVRSTPFNEESLLGRLLMVNTTIYDSEPDNDEPHATYTNVAEWMPHPENPGGIWDEYEEVVEGEF